MTRTQHGYARGDLVVVVDCADLDAEVGRITALGAIVLTSAPIVEHGWAWHVLADPDGNEFCILQPPADYWPASPLSHA